MLCYAKTNALVCRYEETTLTDTRIYTSKHSKQYTQTLSHIFPLLKVIKLISV